MNYVVFALLSVVFAAAEPSDATVDLKIMVTNINTLKGSIKLGVFNSQQTFLQKGQEYKTYSNKVTGDTAIFLLKGLTKAEYAISVYHDINADNECNLNFIGMPIEPYGFSRNYKPKYSKPSFKDCKIDASQNTPIAIRLID